MSAIDGPITPTEVLQRAQYWTTNPPPTGYNQNGSTPDPDGKPYRSDCSGYVSMCWHLGDSPNTSAIAGGVATSIDKASLQPGDVLCALPGGVAAFGHVVLFDHWLDAGQSSYFGHEFGYGASPLHHAIPYPYFPNDRRTFKPYHYPKLQTSNGSPVSVNAAGATTDTGNGSQLPFGLSALGIGGIAIGAIIVVGLIIVMSQV